MSGFAIRHLNKEESHWYTTNFNNFQNRIGGLGGTVQIDQECNCDDARLFFAYILENVLTIYLNHILNKISFLSGLPIRSQAQDAEQGDKQHSNKNTKVS